MKLMNKSLQRGLTNIKTLLQLAIVSVKRNNLMQAGEAFASARDCCEALAVRIGCLADALDEAEYHNAELYRLRNVGQRLTAVRVEVDKWVMQVESALGAA